MKNKKNVQAEISRRLKAFYDSVQQEEIPERFLDLLEKLDHAEMKAGQPTGKSE